LVRLLGPPPNPTAGGGPIHYLAASAEAGREFDKLATNLTTPRDSLTREVELGSQPQPDAAVNLHKAAFTA
jgi:hypothetical protein